jgi:mono/diheme cytochrome c family protein
MTRKLIGSLLLCGVMVFGAACGTVATPEWEVAEAETAVEATDMITAPPTAIPPTATTPPTAVAPTATPSPTAVPPTATIEPTDEPATAATADPIAEAIAAGDVDNGMTVFNASYQTSSGAWMCSTCHSVDESEVRLVGPALYKLYDRADERATESGDPDGITYVVNSIIAAPDYHVPADPPYPENLMPQNYSEVLTEQELADVVAYILTLGNPDA